MQCCKSREWNLRKFLKKKLIDAGFRIIEDDYSSYRKGKYQQVHNMLAIRGTPRICLVAHTDVCRDHGDDIPDVNPTIKNMEIDGEFKKIIQDKNCEVQVGGDDRLGVAINSWIALNTGYDLGLLFTTDEEVGVVSAEYVHFPELLDFDLLLQVDRGNRSHQLVSSIGGELLCSYTTANRLIQISKNIDHPRYIVDGMLTDVLALKINHMCKEAVNMTCGYHNSIGAQMNEYIDIQEAKDTMQYVSSIIQYYDLEEDKNEHSEETIWQESYERTKFPSGRTYSNTLRGRASVSRRRYYDDDLFSDDEYEKDKNSWEY
jgi:hypothetical protein